jgi:Tol biopolymer transport system component
MAADGSDQRRLIQAHGDGIDFSLPVYSPAGDRIAYTLWKNERNETANTQNFDQTASVWTSAADGTDAHVLVEGSPDQAWTPAWSPDGKWIAYTFSPQDAPVAQSGAPQAGNAPGQLTPSSVRGSGELWVVAADGSVSPRRLSREGQEAVAPAWSPDSTSVAFETNTGESSDIHVATVTADGLADERSIAADPGHDWGPNWSPDGRSIAFVSDRSGNEEIWIAPADGSGDARQLTNDGAGDWVPAFSPDGTRIAFVSDRSGDSEVWSMAADGSDLRNLTNHPGYIDGQWSVSWSPDGSRLVYAMAPFPRPESSYLVRNDYAAAEAVLFSISLAIVAILLVALGAPLGSFTVATLVIVALSVAATEGWEYLPAAAVAGVLVDLLVRSLPARRRARAAAAALPALSILAIGITLGTSQSLAWSLTVLLGLATAGAMIGWGFAYAVERLFRLPGDRVAAAEREG